MKYEDSKLLLEFGKMAADVAAAIGRAQPERLLTEMGAQRAPISETTGYRRLRAWFSRLSERAKARARRDMEQQILAVRKLLADAAASGTPVDLAELQIVDLDESGDELQTAELQRTWQCPGSGRGIPGVENDLVTCPACLMRWDAHGIGFKIPPHEPVT